MIRWRLGTHQRFIRLAKLDYVTNWPSIYGAPYDLVSLCDTPTYHMMGNILVYSQLVVAGINEIGIAV